MWTQLAANSIMATGLGTETIGFGWAGERLRMDQHVNGGQASFLHAAVWRKSSYSNPSGNCLEIAELAGGVALRDSRFPDGPVLAFTIATWDVFLRGLKRQGQLG